jgi:hypothetical protein
MPASGAFHRVALVRTDVSEERLVSTFTMTRTNELGTSATLCHSIASQRASVAVSAAVPSSPILVTLMMQNVGSYRSHTTERPIRRHSSSCVVPRCVPDLGGALSLLHRRLTVLWTSTALLSLAVCDCVLLCGATHSVCRYGGLP